MGVGSSHVDLVAPGEVVWIARQLEDAGFAAWAVGGAVRDALAGGHPEDWDIATSARPTDVRRIFRRTVPIGVEHGTVGVIGRSGRMYEVTTFRRDVETFGRKARVAFSDSLDEDLERRDFTINAVAWHPLRHEVRDPHGGLEDLKQGVLQTVGDPAQRFAEDRLRVLRALRFAGKFKLQVEPLTWRAIVESADKLGNLSAERVREELWKVLSGQRHPSISLQLYGQSGVLAALFPSLEPCVGASAGPRAGKKWDRLLVTVDAVSPRHPLVRAAALLHALPAAEGTETTDDRGGAAGASAAVARELLRRLRCSNAEIDRVTHLVAQHDPRPAAAGEPELRRWLRKVGREYVNDLFRLFFALCRAWPADDSEVRQLLVLHARSRSILRSGIPLAIGELPVGGDDLRAMGIPPGPRYGDILREALEWVTDDTALNDRTRLLERLRKIAGPSEPPE